MKRLALILSALVLLALLAAAGVLFWVHGYLNSAELRGKIETKLTQTLGTPVTLGKLHFRLFSGFELGDASVAGPNPKPGEPLLGIRNVHLSYSPLDLLRQKLLIREFVFDDPALHIRFRPDGSLNLPALPPSSDSGFVLADTSTVSLTVQLDRFQLNNGTIRVLAADNSLLFGMEQTGLEGRFQLLPRGARAEGSLGVGTLALGPAFKITSVRSPVVYADDRLSLSDLQGRAYHGTASGNLTANFGVGGPGFEMKLRLDQADVAALLADFGNDSGWISGKLMVTTGLQGSLLQPKLATGNGELEVTETSLAKLQLLNDLASLLNLPELPGTKFDSVKGTFKISDQKVTFFNLEALSPDLQITAAGSVGFDKQLDFDVFVALSGRMTASIPPEIARQLATREDGFRSITFHLSGTMEEPRTNLAEKLTKAAVGVVLEKVEEKAGSFLRNLLKKDTPSSPATPTPSPAPETPEPATPAPEPSAPPAEAGPATP